MLNIQERHQEQAIAQMVRDVHYELVNRFEKTETESRVLVEKCQLVQHLKKHPIALHDSSYDLALAVLLKNKDFETLEKHES